MARIHGLSPERASLTARLAYRSIRRRLGKLSETWPIAAHCPWVLRGWGAFELALERSRFVEPKLKALAEIKTSMLVGCPGCIDVHAFLGRGLGISEAQLRGLTSYHDSDAFSRLETCVLDYAVAMARTPVDVPDALFDELRRHLSDAQLVELTAVIAHENFRARFNRPFRVAAAGFSGGAYCPLPESPATAPTPDDGSRS
jgi:4-carboxymuconolactone decarboxylase